MPTPERVKVAPTGKPQAAKPAPKAPPPAKPAAAPATGKTPPKPSPKPVLVKPPVAGALAAAGSALAGRLLDVVGKESPGLISIPGRGGVIVSLTGVIPTGCPQLDAALGRGGWPMGRLSVIAGGEGGGKTTMALLACASVQRMGGIAVYCDAEHKLDLTYAAALGVDIHALILIQPLHLESCLALMISCIKKTQEMAPSTPMIIILDSINACKSKEEIEGEVGDGHIGAQARVFSEELPKVIRAMAKERVALLWVSQPRDKISTMPGQMGAKNLVAGGNAPKFYAAVIVDLYRKGFLKDGEKKVGSMMVAKVVKNQVAVPFKEADVNIRWGLGVEYLDGLIKRGADLGLLSVGAGGWVEIEWPEELGGGASVLPLKWQGRPALAKVHAAHPELFDWLEKKHNESFTIEVKAKVVK